MATYQPRPANDTAVELPEDLLAPTEPPAANAHGRAGALETLRAILALGHRIERGRPA
jgi:hypothetical protein